MTSYRIQAEDETRKARPMPIHAMAIHREPTNASQRSPANGIAPRSYYERGQRLFGVLAYSRTRRDSLISL